MEGKKKGCLGLRDRRKVTNRDVEEEAARLDAKSERLLVAAASLGPYVRRERRVFRGANVVASPSMAFDR